MKKLFLTSTMDTVAFDLVKHIDIDKNKKLVFIYTASEPEEGDKSWLTADRKSLVDVGFEVFDYTITNKTLEEIDKDLSEADIFYFSGGSSYYLLEQSKKTGFISWLKNKIENKIYMSTSAGSVIAGPKLPEYLVDLGEVNSDQESLEAKAYNLVNFIVLPHWGSKSFKDRYLSSRIQKIYSEDQSPIILLTDRQYIIVEDGKMEVVEVKN